MRAVIQQQSNGVYGPGRANAEGGETDIARSCLCWQNSWVTVASGICRVPPRGEKVETMFYYRRGLCLCDWLIGVPT